MIPLADKQKWGDWLTQQVAASGAIIDPHLGRALDFQYHYAAFLLGRAITEPAVFPTAIDTAVRDYQQNIPAPQKQASAEFHSFLLTLAALYTSLTDRPQQTNWLASALDLNLLSPAQALHQRNNNFTAMTWFAQAHAHRWQTTAVPSKIELQKWRERVLSFQTEDGFFIDTTCTGTMGLPSLSYHLKITAVVLLQAYFAQDSHLLACGLAAINTLENLAPLPHQLAYGRTQNALFGLANDYLATALLTKLGQDKRDRLVHLAARIQQLAQPSGEHDLNFGGRNSQRPGFDIYMYPIVYNSYAWAIVTLADALPPRVPLPVHPFVPAQSVHSGLRLIKQNAYQTYLHVPPASMPTGEIKTTCHRYLAQDARYEFGLPALIFRANETLTPAIPTLETAPRYFGDGSWLARGQRMSQRLQQAIQQLVWPLAHKSASALPVLKTRGFVVQPTAVPTNITITTPHTFTITYELVRHDYWRRRPPQPIGTLRYTADFQPQQITFLHDIILQTACHGRLYHLNLRLPAQPFHLQNKTYTSTDQRLRWQHTPHPHQLDWHTYQGTDGSVQFATGWQLVNNLTTFHSETRLEIMP